MLDYCDLGCMQVGLKSFEISVDYRVYMGSSSRIWSFRRLFLYLCSYKLVGSVTITMVTPSLWSSPLALLLRMCYLSHYIRDKVGPRWGEDPISITTHFILFHPSPLCNRTIQIIRAQVQKRSLKRSKSHTWAHIIPVVHRNHEGFQTNLHTTKIVHDST